MYFNLISSFDSWINLKGLLSDDLFLFLYSTNSINPPVDLNVSVLPVLSSVKLIATPEFKKESSLSFFTKIS